MPAADDSAAALRLAVDGLAAGREVVLATVLRTFGSSPRPPGSLWAIVEPADARPAMEGSVSGGCVEDD
ncbi:MAG: XdhC family protein, partial [Hyphomicrobiales bacterium]